MKQNNSEEISLARRNDADELNVTPKTPKIPTDSDSCEQQQDEFDVIIETILAAHKKRCLPITDTIEEVEEPSTLNDASAKGN